MPDLMSSLKNHSYATYFKLYLRKQKMTFPSVILTLMSISNGCINDINRPANKYIQ